LHILDARDEGSPGHPRRPAIPRPGVGRSRKNEVASLAIARSMAPLANQVEGKMLEPLKRSHIKREAAQARAYSQAVITEGARTIWLAGQGAAEDSSGRSLAADFDGQVREVFARLGRTLEEAGGRLPDMVTMTVFITDARLGARFTQLRREIFGDNYPASALITVAGLARPEMLVEVQGIAVAGGQFYRLLWKRRSSLSNWKNEMPDFGSYRLEVEELLTWYPTRHTATLKEVRIRGHVA